MSPDQPARRCNPAAVVLFAFIFNALLIAGVISFPAYGQSSDPAVVGQWSAVQPWPYKAIHTHLLPTGKVMFYSSYENADDPQLWEPTTGLNLDGAKAGYNIFCTGHAFLADGRLFVTGGHVEDFWGLPNTYTYNPTTDSWARLPDMNNGRWYPTNTALANGDMLTVGGQIDTTAGMNPLPQVWQTASNSWRNLTNAQLVLPFYPYMFLAPNGKVFNAGPEQTTRYLTTSGTGAWSVVANNKFGTRNWGTAVMYDAGKVLLVGGARTAMYGTASGGEPPTATAEVIDLNAATPAWRYVSSMNLPRKHHNATLLPDGKVLVTGGSSGAEGTNENSTSPAYAAEMWDPATDTWTMLAGLSIYRGYHATALLLPDGRVLSASGDFGGPSYEVYSPPYLFKGLRPTIILAPESVGYGKTFFVQTPDAANITKVTWIRLSSVSHSFNFNQRINNLSFSQATGGLNVTSPSDANGCPPGHYMLFILNGNGVPSVAKIVRVDASSSSAFQEQGGQVVMEAENYDAHVSRNSKSWTARTDLAGYVGSAAMVAEPDTGTNQNTGYAAASPELQYRVQFSTAGTYYVWVRMYGNDDNNNTVHVGINGGEVASADRIVTSSYGSWTWTQSTMDNAVATISVPSAGVHTINLWMREDGARVDRLLLTTNSGTVPSGAGPAESPRTGGPPSNALPTVNLTAPANGATFTAPANITVSANAADGDGSISKVDFYAGATLIGTDTTSPYSITWSNVAAGDYTLTAKATDNNSATTTSSGVSITVNAPATPAPAAPSNLTATATTSSQINLAWTDNANNEDGVRIERCQGGGCTNFSQIVQLGAGTTSYSNTGLAAATSYTYRVRAYNGGGNSAYSNTATATTLGGSASGTGLKGEYFNKKDFSELKVTRTDATVNFDWGSGSPAPSIDGNTFSVRWTGQIQPRYSQTYTFYTTSDDGVRLWVNGQQLINNWTEHSPTENTGTITLTANQKYDIRLEYYEKEGGAVIKLSWSSASQTKQIIPQSQLFP